MWPDITWSRLTHGRERGEGPDGPPHLIDITCTAASRGRSHLRQRPLLWALAPGTDGIPHRTRTHTHLKQESAFAARRLHVHNGSMVNEGEVMIVGYDHVQVAIPSGAEPVARDYYGG